MPLFHSQSLCYVINSMSMGLYPVPLIFKVFDKENMALRGLKITWVCIAILFNSRSIIL